MRLTTFSLCTNADKGAQGNECLLPGHPGMDGTMRTEPSKFPALHSFTQHYQIHSFLAMNCVFLKCVLWIILKKEKIFWASEMSNQPLSQEEKMVTKSHEWTLGFALYSMCDPFPPSLTFFTAKWWGWTTHFGGPSQVPEPMFLNSELASRKCAVFFDSPPWSDTERNRDAEKEDLEETKVFP